jgi:hypothetical protein
VKRWRKWSSKPTWILWKSNIIFFIVHPTKVLSVSQDEEAQGDSGHYGQIVLDAATDSFNMQSTASPDQSCVPLTPRGQFWSKALPLRRHNASSTTIDMISHPFWQCSLPLSNSVVVAISLPASSDPPSPRALGAYP